MDKIVFNRINKVLAGGNVRWLAKGYTIATNRLLCDKSISPPDKLTYLILFMHAMGKGECFVSIRKMAEELGYGHSQIQKSVKNLAKVGYIKIVGKKNKANHYVIYGK